MGVRPLGARVLIEEFVEGEKKTRGGIILPGQDKEKYRQGKVVSVGRKFDETGNEVPFQVKPGELVLFGRFNVLEVDRIKPNHVILQEEDLVGVVE